jgi:predicted  nucleic acid-binding Zn ribbon protein
MAKIGLDLRMASEIQSGISRYALQLAKNILAINSEHAYYIIYSEKNFSKQKNNQRRSPFFGI